MPLEWTWDENGQPHRVAIVDGQITQTKPWNWSRAVDDLPDYLLTGLPLEVQEPLLRHVAAQPLRASAPPRDHLRTAFWRHVGRIETITDRVVDLPENMQLRVGPIGAVHGVFTHDRRWFPSSRQTWDRFLLDGPEAWQVPLDVRRDLRERVLAAVASVEGFDASTAFPLIDYARVERGEWQFSEGIRGDFVNLLGDRVEIGGWDNPRDGGSNYRSIESFLRSPSLATGLADKSAVIVARILAARCE